MALSSTPSAISRQPPTLCSPSSAPLRFRSTLSRAWSAKARRVLVRRALERAGLDPDTPGALERFLAHYDDRLLDTTRPYPGMVETVTRASRQTSTGRPHEQTRAPDDADPEGLGMDGLFSDVIGGDSAHGRKPDPAGLLDLVARAGVTPAGTLLVGDSPVDLATARRAGTHICLARYGFGYRFDGDGFRGDEFFIDEAASCWRSSKDCS